MYGALELSADYLPVLDPTRHTATQVKLTVRDPNTPATSSMMPRAPSTVPAASAGLEGSGHCHGEGGADE